MDENTIANVYRKAYNWKNMVDDSIIYNKKV